MEKKYKKITGKQEGVFRLIKEYAFQHGETPTITELREMLGVKSLRTVTQYLDTLERKGLIYRKANKKRGIVLADAGNTVDYGTVFLPVVASAGCDNANVFAEEQFDDYITVDKEFIPSGKNIKNLVIVKAVGDSMQEGGIENGDLVLVEKVESPQLQERDRVVAVFGDNIVIKRIHFTQDALILNPDSSDPQYKPIVMKKNFHIPGRVLDVIRTKPDEPEMQYLPI